MTLKACPHLLAARGLMWPGPWAICMRRSASSKWICSAARPQAAPELVGRAALEKDKVFRLHRFRHRAAAVLAAMTLVLSANYWTLM